MTSSRILVTGANGFVGRAVVARLLRTDTEVIAATRRAVADMPSGVRTVTVGDIDARTDWTKALQGCAGVVHLAARVHVMKDDAADPVAAFRAVNLDGTLNLARQAMTAGARRFVFMSTIKVHGEGRDAPYTEADAPAPEDPYALSKHEAEEGLRALTAESASMDSVILRPPLVYGPGVRANLLALLRLVDKGWPLPFGGIRNRRSLVCVGNLADAVAVCLARPDAANKTFLVTDGEDVSTPDLIRQIAAALGRRPALLNVPPFALRGLAALLGRGRAADRLLGSLTADSAALRRTLGWTPPMTLRQGLDDTVLWYRQRP